MKHAHGARYVEMVFRLNESVVGERVLEDIAAYNAQVEVASQATSPSAAWFARLT